MKKYWDIGKLIAYITVITVGVSFAGQVRKNTSHRITQMYFQVRGWIEVTERECGKDALRCSAAKQNMVRDWKLQASVLGKKVGLE